MPDQHANLVQVRRTVSIHRPGDTHTHIFTLDEAFALFPLVQRLTAHAAKELEPVGSALREQGGDLTEIARMEGRYESVVRAWTGKMERLGLVVKGLWLVDFDTGDGYLCWKFPELRIGHYHSYHEGFGGRRPLQDIIEELDPDWAHL